MEKTKIWPDIVLSINKDIQYLAILSGLTLILGLYLLLQTVVISKDGVFYIEIARQFEVNLSETIRTDRTSPGYPFLIFLACKAVTCLGGNESVSTWIYCAQGITLCGRMFSIIILFFIGKHLFGNKACFLSLLILILLPYPAEYGCDALRDWPYMFMLFSGLLCLLLGAKNNLWWWFGPAGAISGLGYIIRPECAQIVIYGLVWLTLGLARPAWHQMSRLKLVAAIFILLFGFALTAGSYQQTAPWPAKVREYFSSTQFPAVQRYQDKDSSPQIRYHTAAAGIPRNIVNAIGTLISKINLNLFYVFTPAMGIGLYCYLRGNRLEINSGKFFLLVFILLNVAMPIVLYVQWGYISRRHVLPLTAMLTFYIPGGLRIISLWLNRKISGENQPEEKSIRRWVTVFMLIGVCACAGKLIRMTPFRWEKKGYRDTAEWLHNNTTPADFIAVPDRRIYFYAEREGMEYQEKIPKRATYAVSIEKNRDNKPDFGKETQEVYSTWVNPHRQDAKLVVYQVIPKKP